MQQSSQAGAAPISTPRLVTLAGTARAGRSRWHRDDPRRPLRIAFIGARGVIGTYSGIETYYEEVGSRLAERGNEVTAYCRSYFTPPVGRHRGIRLRRLPCVRTKHLETLSHSVLATLDAAARRYDVVQFHALGSAFLAALPRLLGQRTVVSVRGLDWQRAKWGKLARTALRAGEWTSARAPDATVVVSEQLQRHYRDRHRRDAACIRNAIIAVERRPPRRILEAGLRPGAYVLYAGRVSPEKGVDTLLEALRPLPRVQVAIAGGSSYSDDYVRRVRAMAWDDVVFLGQVDRSTMEELYTSCFAYVLPSAMEGLSVGLLEALSYGSCIVASDIPENLEVVGSAALVFPPHDVAALRSALERLLVEPQLAPRLRRAAAERACSLPSWDDVARETEDLYRRLVFGTAALSTA